MTSFTIAHWGEFMSTAKALDQAREERLEAEADAKPKKPASEAKPSKTPTLAQIMAEYGVE